tara:strand:+ start:197 stop:328 length:132 start_codon:yes stop_codon:yes gene_type:complete
MITVLVDNLDLELVGYVGGKINHFSANTIVIKPIIPYIVLKPN